MTYLPRITRSLAASLALLAATAAQAADTPRTGALDLPPACHRYAWDYHRTTAQLDFAAGAGLDRCADPDQDAAEQSAAARNLQGSR